MVTSSQDNSSHQITKTKDYVIKNTIRDDPFITSFLNQLPQEIADSFKDEQLFYIKICFGTRLKAKHTIDIRKIFGFGSWRYYWVFLLGRNRRDLSKIEVKINRFNRLIRLCLIPFLLSICIVIALYLIKSFLGIDIFPQFSFGLWHALSS